MRASELTGCAGKQPDGSAKTREAKLCTVWSAEGRAPDGTPVRDPGSVTYSAAIESAATRDTDPAPSAFAQRVRREAQRRGFDHAARQVVLGDGAPWIWNLAEEHFPGALQIVDRFHAKEHLSAVAKALYGPTSDVGRAWAKQRHAELDAGDLAALAPGAQPPRAPLRRGAYVRRVPSGTAPACATPCSTPKVCAPPPGSSRPAARWPSAHGSSVPECTGPSAAPTPSSPSAVAGSVAGLRTSGHGARWHDASRTPLFCRAPWQRGCTTYS